MLGALRGRGATMRLGAVGAVLLAGACVLGVLAVLALMVFGQAPPGSLLLLALMGGGLYWAVQSMRRYRRRVWSIRRRRRA